MTTHTFARWVSVPENRLALLAVQRVAECVGADRQRRTINPLFLHGPSGTGKTHLVSALSAEVTRRRLDAVVSVLPSRELETEEMHHEMPGDLLVVEDLQHLRATGSERFVQMFDDRLARQQQMVFTANVGPGQLGHLPARLTSRLACGLVVGLEPFAPASRLAFLHDCTQRRQLALSRDVLVWLADHLEGSGRQLEGAIVRLEALVRVQDRLPDLVTVAEHFREEVEANRPTVERIAHRVSRHFRVDLRQMQAHGRSRNVLLPRQIGMYLARQADPVVPGRDRLLLWRTRSQYGVARLPEGGAGGD